jgi:hypothetical protein
MLLARWARTLPPELQQVRQALPCARATEQSGLV